MDTEEIQKPTEEPQEKPKPLKKTRTPAQMEQLRQARELALKKRAEAKHVKKKEEVEAPPQIDPESSDEEIQLLERPKKPKRRKKKRIVVLDASESESEEEDVVVIRAPPRRRGRRTKVRVDGESPPTNKQRPGNPLAHQRASRFDSQLTLYSLGHRWKPTNGGRRL